MRRVKPGVWRHWKGKCYRVYGEAVKSGTEDSSPAKRERHAVVVYRPLYGKRRLTYRPKTEFLERVPKEGRLVLRFQRIGK